jgi:predicted nuclease of restriction endonuclease-like (RecB) superfamily
MNELNFQDSEYKDWLSKLKTQIRTVQLKTAITVNSTLILFYWELGKMITEKQSQTKWGDKLIDQLAKDLKTEFPEIKGLSRSNLFYTRQFYLFYQQETTLQGGFLIIQQLVGQIPWGHNILIFTKSKHTEEARFYLQQTIENQWSRERLALQLKSGLYERQGKAITNFSHTLPSPLSELAQETLKDPYVFDFLTLSEPYHEKDIEKQLITHITKFLLELGKGFAFIGQQYHLEIAANDYYIDLLFYHIKLKCYVVIELKNTRFIPEYAGKLNFYLSAIDSLLKQPDDKPTIGILLCRDKNNIEVEFSLRDINKPMGVSEFQLTEILPDNLKSNLPTIEEIENQLKNI